jgi:hypothetical protein
VRHAFAFRAALVRVQQDAAVDVADWFRGLAVVLQWIHAGELARRHCEENGISKGVPPWDGLIGFRGVLAHSTEDEVDYALVRLFSRADVREYWTAVEHALNDA